MRRRLSAASWLWLVLGSAYFVLPLVATFVFSTQTSRHGHSLDAYATVLREAQFRSAIFFSLRLAIATIVVSTLLLVPTAYWVHLKLPRLRPLMELTTILPLVVPPIVLVVGLAKTFQSAPGWVFGEGSAPFHIPAILVGAYTVLAFPYVYRSVDTGLRAIDIHTLTEASLSLGASWTTTIARVIVPNLRPAVLNGAFLTLAIVMGEFTMASLLGFVSFAVYIAGVGQSSGIEAAALSIVAFVLTWAAMLALLIFTRAPGGRRVGAAPGGAG